MSDQQIPRQGEPLADRGRGDWRNRAKKLGLAILVVGGLMVQRDLRDGALDWSLTFHDGADRRCREVSALSSATPKRGRSDVEVQEILPRQNPPPPTYSLRADLPLDLEAALEGHAGYEPQWREALTRYRYQHGWLRVWVEGSANNLFVQVYEFATPADAQALQEWAGSFACVFAHEVFAVDGVPGSVGQRIKYYEGRLTEQVSFVRGNRRYLVLIGSFNDDLDRSVLFDLTRALDERAT